MAAKYGYVRYLDDDNNKSITVPISWIANFDHQIGIKKNKKYNVRWPNEHGEYYDAELLYIGESEEAIAQLVANRRVRYQNKDHLVTDSDTAVESDLDTTGATRPAKIRKVTTNVATQNTHMKRILDEKMKAGPSKGSEQHNINPTPTPSPSANRDQLILHEEVVKLRKENLQLKKNNAKNNDQIAHLTRLNMELQGTCINNVQELLQKLNYIEDSPPTNIFPVIGKRHRDNTHIGNGVWIPTQQHDSLMLSFPKVKDGSKLVTNLACCVFGTAILGASSVTGKKCNAKKDAVAKPPLDPKKLLAIREFYKWWLQTKKVDDVVLDAYLTKIGTIIASKIYDLNRPIRTPNKSEAVTSEDLPIGEDEHDRDSPSPIELRVSGGNDDYSIQQQGEQDT